MRGPRFLFTLLLSSFAIIASSPVRAQDINVQSGAVETRITRDSTIENLSIFTPGANPGDRSVITGGTTVTGANTVNLFHSFEEFSIGENDSVYFLNPSNADLIFSRVTGRNQSDIFGTLGVDGPGDLYFINPNGIVFGENATLDLEGAFSATTADGIRGGDSEFSTIDSDFDQLLNVSPSAFFFRTSSPNAAIAVRSNPRFDLANNRGLQVLDRQQIVLVGGNILLNNGAINAWEGSINLAAVAAEGSVEIQESGVLSISGDTPRGNITLSAQSILDVQLDFGGSIQLLAHDILLTGGSQILGGVETDRTSAQNQSNELSQSGDVVLGATGAVTLSQANSSIQNVIEGGAEGKPGNLEISAQTLNVSEGAEISTSTLGVGDAGTIDIKTQGNTALNSGSISSRVGETASGRGGAITLNAENVLLTNGSEISSSSQSGGNSGSVFILARDLIEAQNGSRISTSATEATGGALALNAGTVILRGNSRLESSSTAERSSTGSSPIPDLLQDGDDFAVLARVEGGGSQVVTITDRNGVTRTITQESENRSVFAVSNFDTLDFNGDSSDINQSGRENFFVTAEDGTIFQDLDGDGIFTATKAGDISVTSDALIVIEGSDIFAPANGGNGGRINLSRTTLFSPPASSISRNVLSAPLTEARLRELRANGRVDINADSAFQAGEISINSTNLVENSLTELSDDLADSDVIVADSCIARVADSGGTFTLTGGDRLPPTPTEVLSNPYSVGTVQPISTDTNTLTEPSAVYELADGRLVMGRDCGH